MQYNHYSAKLDPEYQTIWLEDQVPRLMDPDSIHIICKCHGLTQHSQFEREYVSGPENSIDISLAL